MARKSIARKVVAQKAKPASRLPRPLRVVRARPRLFVAALVGLIVAALAPSPWWLSTRLLVGWDVGVALYLAAAYEIVVRSDTARLRWRAAREDEGQVAILALTVAAAIASIGAIVVLLGSKTPGGPDGMQLALATATVLLSWFFIHTIFALHYAHEYYGESGTRKHGLNFPGENEPDYWDFVYFSFVIGMTSQVSDVAVSSRPVRRTIIAHSVVSFIYNVALVALMVNIAGSAI